MTCVTGDETGLMKVWDITRSSGPSLRSTFGHQTRQQGVIAMCWVDRNTTDFLSCAADGIIRRFGAQDGIAKSSARRGVTASTATSLNIVGGKLVAVEADGTVAVTTWDDRDGSLLSDEQETAAAEAPADCLEDEERQEVHRFSTATPDTKSNAGAVHIHRRFQLVAIGGNDTELSVWDVASERFDKPLFRAKNIRDHILDVPYPVYNTGVCIVSSHVYVTCTAFHQVRFYDRRASERPTQEFMIDREISRRPTALVQYNQNKFLIGEASGDVHLYDTRRGFASRAKLHGVGSVRQIVKHPAGYPIVAVVGLDRKCRIYHVPTGKLLSEAYLKQRATCALLDHRPPFVDDIASYLGVENAKAPEKTKGLGDAVWDSMVPVQDDFEVNPERIVAAQSSPKPVDDVAVAPETDDAVKTMKSLGALSTRVPAKRTLRILPSGATAASATQPKEDNRKRSRSS